MRNYQCNRVDHDDLPFQLSGIVHSCSSSTSPHSVVDSQQHIGRFHQPMVPLYHTAVIKCAAHIFNRIGLVQNSVIPLLCCDIPCICLSLMRQDTMEMQRRIYFAKNQDNLWQPNVRSVRHPAEIFCNTIFHCQKTCSYKMLFSFTHRMSVSSYFQGNFCGRCPVNAHLFLFISYVLYCFFRLCCPLALLFHQVIPE